MKKKKKVSKGPLSALERANSEMKVIRDFIFTTLPSELQKTYDLLEACNQQGLEYRQDEIIRALSDRELQQLFIYTLTKNRFNPSLACKFCRIDRGVIKRWMETDDNFVTVMDEVNWHKGNFYEECLHNLVSSGDPSAIIFVNRTFNRDRGYKDKDTEVNVNIQNNTVSIETLNLPIETRRQILDAIRETKMIENKESK